MITFLSGFQGAFFTGVCTGLTSFLTLLPFQMVLLLSLLHQRNLPSFHPHGPTAALVLQDSRQRNSHLIQLYFRDYLVTEMKMYRVAIAQVV